MKVVVTGGAGYIGSVVSRELAGGGHSVIVVDNLSQGHREAVVPPSRFVRADLNSTRQLSTVFDKYEPDAVVHFAASTLVDESVRNPHIYFASNIAGGINLVGVMLAHGVRKLVFSSSCAVYGQPKHIPIRENHPMEPLSPYGETKLAFERMLVWYGRANGLRSISLRYFNAAGASAGLGEDHKPETHLIPNVLKVAMGKAPLVTIFGNDYPTPDGTCIRDYVHVLDLARAHASALERLDCADGDCRAFNIGSGCGHSVFEVVEAVRRVTGMTIPVKVANRRDGDPAILTASPSSAARVLKWKAVHSSLEEIVDSAWEWYRAYPDGYSGHDSDVMPVKP